MGDSKNKFINKDVTKLYMCNQEKLVQFISIGYFFFMTFYFLHESELAIERFKENLITKTDPSNIVNTFVLMKSNINDFYLDAIKGTKNSDVLTVFFILVVALLTALYIHHIYEKYTYSRDEVA